MKNNERLDIDALVEGVISLDDFTKEGFVSVSREDIINRLGITENFFNEFLQGKVSFNLDFAKKLGDTTGIPHDFWLRIQRKFDDTHCD